MARIMCIRSAYFCVAIILCIEFFHLLYPALAAAHQSTPGLSYSSQNVYLPLAQFHLRGIDGPYSTRGNLILGADNRPYLFHGVARDDLEYDCGGDGHYNATELATMGLNNGSGQAYYWGANIVRLPLSESFWLSGNPSQGCSANNYQALVKQVVTTLTTQNLNVMLDLQWTDAGGQTGKVGDYAGDAWAMPDADSVTFWHQVATTYKAYPNVLFELFNEPHELLGWSCWRDGCTIQHDTSGPGGHDRHPFSYQAVGMQTLLDAVRSTGASNLAIVAGLNWGYDLSQIPIFHLNGNNVVYDTHPYPYGSKRLETWDASFGIISASYPVISAESGEYDCKTTYMTPLLRYFDAHDIGWVAWAWTVAGGSPCTYPQLVSNYHGTPQPQMGAFIYHTLQGYLQLLSQEEIPVYRG